MSEAEAKRWLYLYERDQAGTITDSEAVELRHHYDARDKKAFETCPVCGGAFSVYEARVQLEKDNVKAIHCPQCGGGLLSSCGDILGHQKHEVDASIPPEQRLGAFAGWYYPVGCTACNCGILGRGYYPSSYSCCPGAIQLALGMATNPEHHVAAFKFICKHQETFVNSLRGDFFPTYDLVNLTQFRDNHAGSHLAEIITAILANQAT